MSSTIASSILRRFSACAARSALSPVSAIARMSPIRATPADQRGHVGAEARGHVVGVEGAGDRQAEQQRAAHRVGVELQSREDGRGAERAIERGLAVGHRRRRRHARARYSNAAANDGAFVGRISREPASRATRPPPAARRLAVRRAARQPCADYTGAWRAAWNREFRAYALTSADAAIAGAAAPLPILANRAHQPGPLRRASLTRRTRYVQPPAGRCESASRRASRTRRSSASAATR